MKKLLLSLFAIIFAITAYAQPKRSNNWFFGQMAGMNFHNATPVAITGGMLSTNEGCATISDTLGNLLFYTDGVTVWDRSHAVMPNGTGLLGDASSTQSAIIVSKPGSITEHYIFTMDETGGPDGLRYSIVDMSLNNGFGDVGPVKNVFVDNYLTEKLIAVQQLGTQNFWIVVHKWNSNEFYTYSLTPSGFQSTPIISPVGIVHNDSIIQNTYGQMKFNVCGNKLVVAVAYQDTIEIFDFNNASGVVLNPITLPIGFHTYGVEFSKNSQLLYASTYNPSATLVQFDLSSGNAATILASQTILSNTPDIYGLQLANNGKIYVSRSISAYMGEINSPQTVGIGCNYVDNGVFLDPNGFGIYSMLGLPALVASYLRAETFCSTPIGVNEPVDLKESINIFPNPSDGDFTISFSNNHNGVHLKIYDETGRTVEAINSIPANTSFTFGKLLEPGVYFVGFDGEFNKSYKKVVKY